MRTRVFFAGLAVVSSVFIWASDRVTLQGERTIYTAECLGGNWVQNRCTGQLKAGDRFRFRALPPHREVLFWTVGASHPSGKFSGCDVQDGRNWTCPAAPAASSTITLAIKGGEPARSENGLTLPYHAVSKLRWYLLRWGVPTGVSVDPVS